jgi:hypothetical protein
MITEWLPFKLLLLFHFSRSCALIAFCRPVIINDFAFFDKSPVKTSKNGQKCTN